MQKKKQNAVKADRKYQKKNFARRKSQKFKANKCC